MRSFFLLVGQNFFYSTGNACPHGDTLLHQQLSRSPFISVDKWVLPLFQILLHCCSQLEFHVIKRPRNIPRLHRVSLFDYRISFYHNTPTWHNPVFTPLITFIVYPFLGCPFNILVNRSCTQSSNIISGRFLLSFIPCYTLSHMHTVITFLLSASLHARSLLCSPKTVPACMSIWWPAALTSRRDRWTWFHSHATRSLILTVCGSTWPHYLTYYI